MPGSVPFSSLTPQEKHDLSPPLQASFEDPGGCLIGTLSRGVLGIAPPPGGPGGTRKIGVKNLFQERVKKIFFAFGGWSGETSPLPPLGVSNLEKKPAPPLPSPAQKKLCEHG